MFLITAGVIIFITPVRNYLNSLFHKDKTQPKEEQIIGKVSEYNPRIEEIQQILKNARFDPGLIDGTMGDKTRRAIRDFQKAHQLKPTGKINTQTMLALNREKESSKKASEMSPQANRIQKVSHSKPLEPDKKRSQIQDEIMSYRLQSKTRAKQIQKALKNAGFYKGEIDGKFGAQTKKAVREFQKSKGLAADGIAGPKTWDELSKYLKD